MAKLNIFTCRFRNLSHGFTPGWFSCVLSSSRENDYLVLNLSFRTPLKIFTKFSKLSLSVCSFPYPSFILPLNEEFGKDQLLSNVKKKLEKFLAK